MIILINEIIFYCKIMGSCKFTSAAAISTASFKTAIKRVLIQGCGFNM